MRWVGCVCVCVTGCIDIVLSESAEYTDQLRACYHAELIEYCYTPPDDCRQVRELTITTLRPSVPVVSDGALRPSVPVV